MKYSTAQEVAEVLRVSPDTIRRRAKRGLIPAVKIGDAWRFELDRVVRVLETKPAKRNQSI